MQIQSAIPSCRREHHNIKNNVMRGKNMKLAHHAGLPITGSELLPFIFLASLWRENPIV
jgi:hypothetical protein